MVNNSEDSNVISFPGRRTPDREQLERLRHVRRDEIAAKANAIRSLDERAKVPIADRAKLGTKIEARAQSLKNRPGSRRLKAILIDALPHSGDPARDYDRFKYREDKPDRPMHAKLREWRRFSDELAKAANQDPDEALVDLFEDTTFLGSAAPDLLAFAQLKNILMTIERHILARFDIDAAFAYLSDNQFVLDPGPTITNPAGWAQRFEIKWFEPNHWTDPFFSIESRTEAGQDGNLWNGPVRVANCLPAVDLLDMHVGAIEITRKEIDQRPVLQPWFETSQQQGEKGGEYIAETLFFHVISRVSLGFLPLGPGGATRLCVIEAPFVRISAEHKTDTALSSEAISEMWDILSTECERKGAGAKPGSDDERIGHALSEELIFRPINNATLESVASRIICEAGYDHTAENAKYWDENLNDDGTINTDHNELPSASPRDSFAASIERNFSFSDVYGAKESRIDRLLTVAVETWVSCVEAHRKDRMIAFDRAYAIALDALREGNSEMDQHEPSDQE